MAGKKEYLDSVNPPDQEPVNREELRARLRKMTNKELRRFGRDARDKCAPEKNRGKAPQEEFLIQLEEAQVEWKRRIEPRPKHLD